MNQAPDYQTYAPGSPAGPPPRRGAPWWAWLLGGCAGCALLAILVVAGGTFFLANRVQQLSRNVGPVTESRIRSEMGDVPIYPNSTLDEAATRGLLIAKGIGGSLGGEKVRQMFKASEARATSDDPAKVLAFYDKELAARGWKRVRETDSGVQVQHTYQKGDDGLLVQVQNSPAKGTVIMVMRMDAGAVRPPGSAPSQPDASSP